jgi:hypothetical protein
MGNHLPSEGIPDYHAKLRWRRNRSSSTVAILSSWGVIARACDIISCLHPKSVSYVG